MIIGLIIGAIWAVIIMSFINDRKKEKHRQERHAKKWRELQERSIKETGMTIEKNLNYEYPEDGENITIKRYIAYIERLLTDLREKIVDINLSGFYTEQEKNK